METRCFQVKHRIRHESFGEYFHKPPGWMQKLNARSCFFDRIQAYSRWKARCQPLAAGFEPKEKRRHWPRGERIGRLWKKFFQVERIWLNQRSRFFCQSLCSIDYELYQHQ